MFNIFNIYGPNHLAVISIRKGIVSQFTNTEIIVHMIGVKWKIGKIVNMHNHFSLVLLHFLN